MNRSAAVLLLWCGLRTAPAAGDALVVGSGGGFDRVLECVITEETDASYRVEQAGASATYPKTRVLRVERYSPEENAALRARWDSHRKLPARSAARVPRATSSPGRPPRGAARTSATHGTTGKPSSVEALRKTDPEAALRLLISTLREHAANITIDGDAADWDDLPRYADPTGDIVGPGSLDIVEVAVAARERDLLVMLRTAGPPLRDGDAYWLYLDLAGGASLDCRLGLGPGQDHTLRLMRGGKVSAPRSIRGLQVARGAVIEVAIPYDVLEQAGVSGARAAARRPDQRPWVRVHVRTRQPGQKATIDRGPAVGAYRLVATLAAFDQPLPGGVSAARSIPLPLRGQWYVGQGPLTGRTHKKDWAYDFVMRDATLRSAPLGVLDTNAVHYSWKQPVSAPADGQVVWSRSDQEDQPPGKYHKASPNGVALDVHARHRLAFYHFAQGSVRALLEQYVKRGDLIGAVGNSGRTNGPHLHVELRQRTEDGDVLRLAGGHHPTLPLALERVVVSLNSGSTDIWRRSLDLWDIREGFFVEAMELEEPTQSR